MSNWYPSLIAAILISIISIEVFDVHLSADMKKVEQLGEIENSEPIQDGEKELLNDSDLLPDHSTTKTIRKLRKSKLDYYRYTIKQHYSEIITPPPRIILIA